MSSFAVFNPAITLSSTNRTIVAVIGGVSETIALTAGTYYMGGVGSSLLSAITTALNSHSSASTFTASVTRNVTQGSNGVSVTITSSSASWYFDVENGAHTFDTTILGMSDTANATAAVSQSSTQQCGGSWASSESESNDDGTLEARGLVEIELADGSSRFFNTSSETWRQSLAIRFLERQRIWTNTARTDFHPALLRMIRGAEFEYHETTISSGTTLTALSSSTVVGATWRLVDAARGLSPRRVDRLQLWDLDFEIREQVSQ